MLKVLIPSIQSLISNLDSGSTVELLLVPHVPTCMGDLEAQGAWLVAMGRSLFAGEFEGLQASQPNT